MSQLAWDLTGEHLYETGVDHGVLYIPDEDGVYNNGVAWNGLTAVTESPSGAEATPLYADNIKYLNLVSAEEFGATIEAYTYPDEFGQFDGLASPSVGVYVGQQDRRTFGFSYRTIIGNDVAGNAYGYKLHLVYNALAAPSEKAFSTVNDSPEAATLSWEVATTPTSAGDDLKPTAQITIDSTKVDADSLAALELLLYGDVAVDPKLPTPEEVIAIFAGDAPTPVNMEGANSPTYNSGTHVVTLPSVTGITWKINGVSTAAGAKPAMTVGQTSVVTAHPAAGYAIASGSDDDWAFDY